MTLAAAQLGRVKVTALQIPALQRPLPQSAFPEHFFPIAQVGQVGPPQSTSVSSSLETPSLQPGAPVSELFVAAGGGPIGRIL